MRIKRKIGEIDDLDGTENGLLEEVEGASEFRRRADDEGNSWEDLDVDFFREEDSDEDEEEGFSFREEDCDEDEEEFEEGYDLDEADWSWKP